LAVSFPYWFCVVVTVISALTSLGFSIAALVRPVEGSLRTARYAASRSVALTVAAAVPIVAISVSWAEAVALAMVIVQAGDATIGLREHDNSRTLGPAVFAVINLVALVLLLRSG
jgi:hypothetical protein